VINPPPDLGALVAAFGFYSAIPPAAWASYDRQHAAWLASVRAASDPNNHIATPDQSCSSARVDPNASALARRKDMDISEHISGGFLKVADLAGGVRREVIAEVRPGKYQNPDCEFQSGAVLTLNATNLRALAADAGPRPCRVLVQPLTGGVEVLIGVVQEPVFGPLVVFGLGGVATEVLSDHVTRLTPLTDADADEMIHAARAAPRLFGALGAPPVDTAALADALLRVSRLADDLPEVSELDLNPVVAREDGAYCVDVRVQITPAEPRDPFLRRLS
jgi:hypothetical protein